MTLTASQRDELFAFGRAHRPVAAPAERRRLRHVPALDGLRGVAVLGVVLFHFEITVGGRLIAKGGFLGVDAFFVLSGYLITGLLLSEWGDSARISLKDFWVRRARRLFPALGATILLVCAFSWFAHIPDVRGQLRGQLLATVAYVANWLFIFSGESYVEQFTFPSPLRHMWSLAIEEQFYVIWPIVVSIILAIKRQARAVMWTALVLAVMSTVWMAAQFNADTDPSRIYYGTDTRLQSLALGAALAAALAEGITLRSAAARRGAGMVAIGATAFLAAAWSRSTYISEWLYTGGFLILALAVCVVILTCVEGPEAGPDNPVAAVLSWAPLRGLGLISYGVYLYHWPVFVILNADRSGLDGWTLTVARIAVTFALAIPSYFLLEQPIRRGDLLERLRFRPQYLALGAVVVLFGSIFWSTSDQKGSFDDIVAAQELEGRPVPSATAGVPNVLLLGDSVAYSLALGFEGSPSAERVKVWNSAQYYCEMVHGPRREAGGKEFAASDACDDWEDEWVKVKGTKSFVPRLVVLSAGTWEIFDRRIDGTWIEFGTPEGDAQIERALQTFVDRMHDPSTRLAFVTMLPLSDNRPPAASEWQAGDHWRSERYNTILRKVAAANPDKVAVIDLAAHLCSGSEPEPCQTSIDGVVLRPDGVHFDTPAAALVAPWLTDQFLAVADAPTLPLTTDPATTDPNDEPATEGTTP